MTEQLSIRDQVEEAKKQYAVLMDNEEYKLETQNLNEKQRQKILGRLFELQEEEKAVINRLQQGPGKVESFGLAMENAGEGMSKAGDSMTRMGCLITLWVFAFPIMIPIWIIKTAFGKKK